MLRYEGDIDNEPVRPIVGSPGLITEAWVGLLLIEWNRSVQKIQ
jgi:hypothetical protein